MKQPLFVRPSWLLLGGMWLAAGAQAADPAGSPASPMLVPSEDGASIIDLRARLVLQATEPLAPDGLQMTWLVTVEREGSDKPACVAESVARSYGAAP